MKEKIIFTKVSWEEVSILLLNNEIQNLYMVRNGKILPAYNIKLPLATLSRREWYVLLECDNS